MLLRGPEPQPICAGVDYGGGVSSLPYIGLSMAAYDDLGFQGREGGIITISPDIVVNQNINGVDYSGVVSLCQFANPDINTTANPTNFEFSGTGLSLFTDPSLRLNYDFYMDNLGERYVLRTYGDLDYLSGQPFAEGANVVSVEVTILSMNLTAEEMQASSLYMSVHWRGGMSAPDDIFVPWLPNGGTLLIEPHQPYYGY